MKKTFYKRNSISFIISLGLIIFSSVFLINSVNAAGINWAASINGGTAELNLDIEQKRPGDEERVNFEGTDGFPERINDEDDNSYITVTWNFAEEPLTWPGWGWGPGIIYEAIVTFSKPVTLNRVEYVRRGHSGTSTCWYRYEGVIMSKACVLAGTEETSLYYNGGWQAPINTRSVLGNKSTEIIPGPWENVEKVKVRVDINQWPYFPHLGRHYIYELRAFGPPPIVSSTVVTNNATGIQQTSTTLNGNITNTGGENPSRRGFEWGTSLGGPYPNSWTEPGSFGTGAFSRNITGLSLGTTYYFRAKAENSAGWGYGLERSFSTTAPPPPPPCGYHNVWGWAWSDNIGWISFSCKDIAGTIDRIRVRMRYQGTIKTYLRLNGAESMFLGEGSAFGAWAERFTAWQPSRPGGGSWTWDDIKDLQVVAGLSTFTFSGTTYQGRLTQIYVEVDDGGSILILRPDSGGDYINIENPPVGSHWDLVDDVVADDFGTYVWTDSGSEQKDAYNLQDPPAAGSTIDYGVDVDETTGEFSGYAWSDNIGWISFNRSKTGAPLFDDACPDGSCIAKLDFDTGQVSGWAKALAASDGWDGWIKLRGLTNEAVPQEYGVSLNPAPTPSEFREWAWGSDVIGWISFNCLDTGACGVSDYKVMTDITITLNNIPSATNLSREQTSGCGSAPIVRFTWNYNDDDNVPPGTDPQSAYEIQIDDDSNLDEDPIATLSDGASTSRDYSPPSFGTTYWWRVRVQDTNGPAWSDWADGPNFTPTKWPDPDFIWCPLEPDINETIQFCSVFGAGVCDQAAEPSCSDMTGSADNLTTCAAGCSLWEWDFGDGGTSNLQNPIYSYSSQGPHGARLTVTDANGKACFKVHWVPANIPLPIWKEIPPF